MGLIDANEFYEYFKSKNCSRCCLSSEDCEYCYVYDFLVAIDNRPRIDAMPVVYAEWEIRTTETVKGDVTYIVHKYFCSECGKQAEHFYNYCPNCGARMDKEK